MPKLGMQPIRQRQLIDATLVIINQVGLHGATVSQIARQAGVSTGIISHYFGDKNGLLEATMRDITSKLRSAVLKRLAPLENASTQDRIHAIVMANFDESQIAPAVTTAWLDFWASSLHQANLHRLQKISSRRLYSSITAEFRRELTQERARAAGYGLTALIDGLWLRTALGGKPFDPQQIEAITQHAIHHYLVD